MLSGWAYFTRPTPPGMDKKSQCKLAKSFSTVYLGGAAVLTQKSVD